MRLLHFLPFLILVLAAGAGPARAGEPLSPTRVGMDRMLAGDARGALVEFDKALAQNPDDLHRQEILGYRAKVLSQLERYDEALADLDRAIALRPTHVIHYSNRGIVKANKGDLAGAIADFGRALALETDEESRYELLEERAGLRIETDDLDGAIADYGEMLKILPEDSDVLRKRGIAHFMSGKSEPAARDFNQAVQFESSPASHFARAVFRSAMGDYAGSLADYDRMAALTDDPPPGPDGTIWSQREVVRQRLQRGTPFAEATRAITLWKDSFEKALALYQIEAIPESELLKRIETGPAAEKSFRETAAHYYIGMSRLLAGNTAAARQSLERAVAGKAPGYIEYLLARGELARLAPATK